MEDVKQIFKLVGGLVGGAAAIVLIANPPLTLVGIPLLFPTLEMAYNGTVKKDIKGIPFKVDRHNKLVENPFGIIRSIKYALRKDKTKNFMNDFIKSMSALTPGEEYKMDSHYFTLKRLQELQELGYIEDLQSEVKYGGKKQSYFFANIAMGNFKHPFKKKEKIAISFKVTGKDFNSDEIKDYVTALINRKNDNLIIPKKNTEVSSTPVLAPVVEEPKKEETKPMTKEELIELRNSLLSMKEDAPVEETSKGAKK